MKKSGDPSRRIPAGAPGHPKTGAEGPRGPSRGALRGDSRGGGREGGKATRDGGRGGRPAQSGEVPPFPSGGRKPATAASRVAFLYEDEDLVAVEKPSGLPVIAPEGSRSKNLLDLVTEHIRQRNPKGRGAVVHRIDRDTSGLLVFAKSAKAKRALMEAWDELVLERRYVALVLGEMGGTEGRLESWLVENRGGEVYVAAPGERGAKRAATNWRLLGSGNDLSLVELELETGRKHQIRVQLAAAGHPVCGDAKYGRAPDPLGRLCLHAAGLVLTQPFTRERLELESPAPPEFGEALRPRGPAGARAPAPRAARAGAKAPDRERAANARGASRGASPREGGSAAPRAPRAEPGRRRKPRP